MDRMRSFFHKTSSTPILTPPTQPVFTGHRISADVVRLMATFIDIEDINALGRTNHTWRQTLYSNIHSLNLDRRHLRLRIPSRQIRMEFAFEVFLRTLSNEQGLVRWAHNSVASLPSPPRGWYVWPLQDFIALQRLSVSNVRSDALFGFIGRVTTLQSLSIRDCSITDAGLKSLISLTALKTLKIEAYQGFMTYAGVAQLQPLPLQKLTLRGFTSASQEVIDVRVLKCLTTLSRLTFCNCEMTHARGLRHMITLQSLKFKGCTGVAFDDIEKFNKSNMFKLNTLKLTGYFSHLESQSLSQIKEWADKRDEPNLVLQGCYLYFVRQ